MGIAMIAVVVLTGACTSTPAGDSPAASTSASGASSAAPVTIPPPAATTNAPKPTAVAPGPSSVVLVVAAGHGWTPAGVLGPVPAPGSCHLRWTATREPMPDPACTPGAIDAGVTQADLSSTVCRPGGYTTSVRPPRRVTAAAKRVILAAYGIPRSKTGAYELDHLVELAAGGASDYRNLWPQPNGFIANRCGPYLENDKNAVEQVAFNAQCARTATLAQVQSAMARDWTTLIPTLALPTPPRRTP